MKGERLEFRCTLMRVRTNMGSVRYWLGADTVLVDILRYWGQAGLVP